MRGKRILILSGGRYSLAAIKTAKRMGCLVAVADRAADAPGLALADIPVNTDFSNHSAIAGFARAWRPDAIVPVNDYGVATASHVGTILGLPCVTPQAAANVRSKFNMRECWARDHVPSLQYHITTSLRQARQAAQRIGLPVVCKPSNSLGGGGRGVSIVRSANELPQAYQFASQAYPAAPEVLVEEFCDGLEHSVESMTIDGVTHIIAISDKIKTPPPYSVATSIIYPSAISGARLAMVENAVRAALASLGHTLGPAHTELASYENKVAMFETGLRCGGGATPDPIVPQVTGIDYFAETIRVWAGQKPLSLTPTRHAGCVYRFFNPAPGMLRKIIGAEEARKLPGVLELDIMIQPGQTINPMRQSLDRVGYVIASGKSAKEALALADKAESMISFITS